MLSDCLAALLTVSAVATALLAVAAVLATLTMLLATASVFSCLALLQVLFALHIILIPVILFPQQNSLNNKLQVNL